MVLLMIAEFIVMGLAVYFIYTGEILAAVITFAISFPVTGFFALRWIANQRERAAAPARRTTADGSRLRFESSEESLFEERVELEPDLEEAISVIARRNRTEAIDKVRELTGTSPRLAQEYVDRLIEASRSRPFASG